MRPHLGTATVIRGNALHLPLADDSVDLICTSPPFLNLRSYQDSGTHYEGQIGTGTRDEFLTQLLDATAEMARVLKPSGSIFVELGDSYSNKSLNLSPHRYAIGCTDILGLILRAEIIWSRPNGLPESVTDRVRRSHSTWFHFTREPRYYSAVDEIREAHMVGAATGSATRLTGDASPYRGAQTMGSNGHNLGLNPLGKLPSSVWQIATQPLIVPPEFGIDHFASFPLALPRRIITGWSPRHVCTACGEGRRPVANVARIALTGSGGPSLAGGHGQDGRALGRARSEATITGYVCACTPYTDHPGTGESSGPTYADAVANGSYATKGIGGAKSNLSDRPKTGPWREYHWDQWTPAPTTPGVVLDPFGGTGTTALTAKALGRNAITIDMSADYCRLATWRTNDPRELAKARQEPFTPSPAPADGQDALFTLDAS